MQEGDRQFVLRARAGDHAAYGELVARHQGRVRGWLRHLCGNHAEADDLAQEAFVRAWMRLGDLNDAGRFSSWLMRIAYNEFLQDRRRAQKRQRLAQRLMTEQEVHGTTAPGTQPEHAIELERVLAILSERERAVVVLNYAYGYSHGEVSEMTGLALGTVKSLIQRGNRKVREKLDERA